MFKMLEMVGKFVRKVKAFCMALFAGAVVAYSAAVSHATALFSITEAQATDLTDTVTTNSALVYSVILVLVGFGIVVGLTRGRKRGI